MSGVRLVFAFVAVVRRHLNSENLSEWSEIPRIIQKNASYSDKCDITGFSMGSNVAETHADIAVIPVDVQSPMPVRSLTK